MTVKSFSIAMGIKRPGFHLLTLASKEVDPSSSQTFADRPCSLPDQLHSYLFLYGPLFMTSIGLILYNRLSQRSASSHVLTSSPGQTPLPLHGRRALREEAFKNKPTMGSRRRLVAASMDFVGWLVLELCAVAWPPVLLYAFISCAAYL